MTAEEILKLIDAGYTKDEISAMTAEPAAEQPEPADNPPDPEQPEPAPEPDPRDIRIEQLQNQMNSLIKQMQQNNLKSASVNILPEDDLQKKTDEAMAELIRPKIKEKEMQDYVR